MYRCANGLIHVGFIRKLLHEDEKSMPINRIVSFNTGSMHKFVVTEG